MCVGVGGGSRQVCKLPGSANNWTGFRPLKSLKAQRTMIILKNMVRRDYWGPVCGWRAGLPRHPPLFKLTIKRQWVGSWDLEGLAGPQGDEEQESCEGDPAAWRRRHGKEKITQTLQLEHCIYFEGMKQSIVSDSRRPSDLPHSLQQKLKMDQVIKKYGKFVASVGWSSPMAALQVIIIRYYKSSYGWQPFTTLSTSLMVVYSFLFQ